MQLSKVNFIMNQMLAAILLIFSTISAAASYDFPDSQPDSADYLQQRALPNQGPANFFPNWDQFNSNNLDQNNQDSQEVLQLIKQGQLVKARKKIAQLITQNPKKVELYNLTALLYAQENDAGSAQRYFNKALELDKDNQIALVGLAKLAFEATRYREAKELANQVIALNNKNLTAYYLLVDIANKQNDLREIEHNLLTAYQKMRGIAKDEVSVAVNLGNYYFKQHQPHKFLSLMQELSSRYPEDGRVLLLLANAQIFNKQTNAAEQTLLGLIEHDKQNVSGRLRLAALWAAQPEKKTEVLKLLDEAAALAPENPQVMLQKATLLTKFKRYDDALLYAEKVDQALPQTGLGKILQGDAYLAQKKLGQALAAYQQAYRVNPNDKVLGLIADIMVAMNRQSAAIELLNNELKKNDNNLVAHFRLATIYQQQKNYSNAARHYQAILAKDAENVLVLNNLAWVYLQQNNPEALALAEKAYQKAPESAAILDTYGTVLVQWSNLKRGIEILEKAIKFAPDAQDIRFHLAQAYEKADNDSKAIEYLKIILNSGQNFSEKDAAIALLSQLQAK